MFNFEAFTCWIYTKEDGAQRDEKDKCYVETYIYVPTIKIPDYTLQQANVGSAYCSENFKGVPPNHWKIRHSLCIPWFGLDLEEKCLILKHLHFGYIYIYKRRWCPTR